MRQKVQLLSTRCTGGDKGRGKREEDEKKKVSQMRQEVGQEEWRGGVVGGGRSGG